MQPEAIHEELGIRIEPCRKGIIHNNLDAQSALDTKELFLPIDGLLGQLDTHPCLDEC